ncbi:hypothetical protein [Actinomadura citrea]|uniref:SnoaL-like domain-containing protein n=1 Tax=Actinomadura citrea TaxID=46158 RepID=A0A7Y9KJD2_9ACTN|nr:hypothetical protein [Actinomadura citrea]NYE17679.1 hypothetical protein [Actinomadura citrea]GGT60993.1 hypothetical protein GCM10010177_16770 [Actinomadura citrea]
MSVTGLIPTRTTYRPGRRSPHRLATAHGAPLWTLGGDYRWELARSGRWLITSVTMTATWGDGNKDLPAQAAG